jgi:hypothetical protein
MWHVTCQTDGQPCLTEMVRLTQQMSHPSGKAVITAAKLLHNQHHVDLAS